MRRRAVAVLCALAVCACNGEKKRLTARLTVLEDQRTTVLRRVESERTAVAETENRRSMLSSELAGHNTEVQAFLLNHKIAAACIRTSRASWGSESSFSNDVSTGVRVGTAVCSVALLNANFAREVSFVGDKLRDAEQQSATLKQQIAALERTIETQRSDIHAHEASADHVAAEIMDVRRRLGQ